MSHSTAAVGTHGPHIVPFCQCSTWGFSNTLNAGCVWLCISILGKACRFDFACLDQIVQTVSRASAPTIAEFADGHHVTHLYRMIDDDDGTDLKFLNMDKAMSHMPSTPQAPVDSSSFEINDRAFEHVDPVSVANLGQWLNLSYAADMEQVSSSSSSSRVEQVSEGQRCDEHMTVQREDIEALRQSKTFGGSTGYEPHTEPSQTGMRPVPRGDIHVAACCALNLIVTACSCHMVMHVAALRNVVVLETIFA